MGVRNRMRERARFSSRLRWRVVRWIIVQAGGLERARLVLMLYTVGAVAVLLVLLVALSAFIYVAPPAR